MARPLPRLLHALASGSLYAASTWACHTALAALTGHQVLPERALDIVLVLTAGLRALACWHLPLMTRSPRPDP